MTIRIGASGVLAALLCTASAFSAATAEPAASTPICEAAPAALTGEAASTRNLKTVQGIYAAFAVGDVPAILACVSEDAAWESWADNFAQRAGVPWLKPQTGRAGAAAFFAYVGEWQVKGFAVKNLMAGGNGVAAEIEVDFDVTQTGAHLQDQEMHYWIFDETGLVTGFRHYNDTAKHIAAAKGESSQP